MVFEFTQFSMPLFPSVSHSIPLTSLDLSLGLFDVNIYTPYQFRDLSDLSLNHFSPITSLSPLSLSFSLRDRLVWQECHTRRGSSRHGDHTLFSLRSVDKWIIRL